MKSGFMLAAMAAGIALGVILGLVWPELSARLDFISLAFVQAIKMIVIPLIFSAVALASYRLAVNSEGLGRITLVAFGWFLCSTLVAALVGLALDRIIEPGIGVHLVLSDAAPPPVFAPLDWRKFFLGLIPANVIATMAEQKVLPTLLFALVFGIALASLGENKARPVVGLLEALFGAIFKMTGWIIQLSPLAVFAIAAWLVATQSTSLMFGVIKLIATMYAGLIIVGGICTAAVAFTWPDPIRLLRKMAEPVLVGFATRSSEVAMPLQMERLIEGGVDPQITSIVVPLGYSFNLDGAALYMTLIIPFLAESYGMQLDGATLATILVTTLVASKGIANVPSGSMVAAAGVVVSLGLPPEAVAIMAAVDFFLDMGRTAVNVFGNTAAATFVARYGRQK